MSPWLQDGETMQHPLLTQTLGGDDKNKDRLRVSWVMSLDGGSRLSDHASVTLLCMSLHTHSMWKRRCTCITSDQNQDLYNGLSPTLCQREMETICFAQFKNSLWWLFEVSEACLCAVALQNLGYRWVLHAETQAKGDGECCRQLVNTTQKSSGPCGLLEAHLSLL